MAVCIQPASGTEKVFPKAQCFDCEMCLHCMGIISAVAILYNEIRKLLIMVEIRKLLIMVEIRKLPIMVEKRKLLIMVKIRKLPIMVEIRKLRGV